MKNIYGHITFHGKYSEQTSRKYTHQIKLLSFSSWLLDRTVLGRFSKRESRCSLQFIFGDHFDHVLAFRDGKRRNGMWKNAVVFTPSLPECLMEVCKVTLTFESIDEILWCDHSNESFLPVLFTWCYLFVKILENEIRKFGRNLPLARIWQWKG